MTDQNPALRLEGIVKTFPRARPLERVSFHVLPGEIHALIGENGAGKSTLMKVPGDGLGSEVAHLPDFRGPDHRVSLVLVSDCGFQTAVFRLRRCRTAPTQTCTTARRSGSGTRDTFPVGNKDHARWSVPGPGPISHRGAQDHEIHPGDTAGIRRPDAGGGANDTCRTGAAGPLADRRTCRLCRSAPPDRRRRGGPVPGLH